MKKCSDVVVMMAHLSFVYVIASIVYLVFTSSLGTPFKDSLTPAQIAIKKEESKKRGCIFLCGICVAIMIVIIIRPFKRL